EHRQFADILRQPLRNVSVKVLLRKIRAAARNRILRIHRKLPVAGIGAGESYDASKAFFLCCSRFATERRLRRPILLKQPRCRGIACCRVLPSAEAAVSAFRSLPGGSGFPTPRLKSRRSSPASG